MLFTNSDVLPDDFAKHSVENGGFEYAEEHIDPQQDVEEGLGGPIHHQEEESQNEQEEEKFEEQEETKQNNKGFECDPEDEDDEDNGFEGMDQNLRNEGRGKVEIPSKIITIQVRPKNKANISKQEDTRGIHIDPPLLRNCQFSPVKYITH